MYLVTTEQMRQLEQATVDAGASWADLMEQAGWGVAQEALRSIGDARDQRALILVGPGNNGGDGLVAARHLHDAGMQVSLYIWQRDASSADSNWQRCRDRNIAECMVSDDSDGQQLRKWLEESRLVVDALLGMGISRDVSGQLAEIIATVKHAHERRPSMTLVAVDIPSGIHSDNGQVMGFALPATLTVATGLMKRGLVLYPGCDYAGTIKVVDIGIPTSQLEQLTSRVIERDDVARLAPQRQPDSHKGTYGKTMIVAGSLYYPGAAVLATSAAGRVGAGLVTLATARSVLALTANRGPETTLLPLPEAQLGTLGRVSAEELLKQIEDYHALLIGPGLAQEEPTLEFLKHLLGLEANPRSPRVGFRVKSLDSAAPAEKEPGRDVNLPPTVIDADGLNLLAKIEHWPEYLPHQRFVLTPHPGEMKRLLDVEALEADILQVAVDAAARWGQVVVLKGATTIIAHPDGRSMVHALGNPALATAGTGDVLSGAIAGLLAQGLTLFDAAVLGVGLHGAAGAMVAESYGSAGALASDLLPYLPRALKALKQPEGNKPAGKAENR